ncbi:MAG: phosphatidate cytidylyltransferase [Bacteroidales bacterium]|nr:phosphatidate cytidylyltransferase [Bacteroidales bacterium]MDD2424758.1 phosphatidate cytidylyltransferase [Bacteroidales bacterium]MDD3988674.1 phosphatidate cytidylyltransferase [Bacteroidales bacterium]MDD4638541.1 phosphatidate cytidylyltransferase [Bacteroidales bacterium]
MRNTIIRTLSGVVFLLLVVGSLLLGPLYTLILFSLFVVIMTYEYLSITIKGKLYVAKVYALISALVIYSLPYLVTMLGLDTDLLMLAAIPPAFLFVSLLYPAKSGGQVYHSHPYLFLPLIYIALPFSLTTAILFDGHGDYTPYLLLAILIFTWASDVGAYIFGLSFGQKNGHKLFPSVSPKKSWEGFAGGFIFALAAAFAVHRLGLINSGLIHLFALSIIVNISGVFGDLVESQLKREFDTKDSGSIMPGHGGLLDRFDSTLISFPTAIAYILIFNIS